MIFIHMLIEKLYEFALNTDKQTNKHDLSTFNINA